MACRHEDCRYDERGWLPIDSEVANTVRHPHCKHCGTVRNLFGDSAVGMGYFMNVLSSMKRRGGKVIADSQIRLISKKLMSMDDFEDRYWMRRSIQEEVFINTVSKYCNFSQNYIKSFL